MTVERGATEGEAHDRLRDAIRDCTLALWDRRITSGEDEEGYMATTRPEVERGVLVDYVVVAVFDSGTDDHTVNATLRTDGLCASYRQVGLLSQALHDLGGA